MGPTLNTYLIWFRLTRQYSNNLQYSLRYTGQVEPCETGFKDGTHTCTINSKSVVYLSSQLILHLLYDATTAVALLRIIRTRKISEL